MMTRDLLHRAACVLALIVAPPWAALAQTPDPANGSTLYHTRYKCTDCHTGSPGPNSGLTSGSTPPGLLQAIDTVAGMSVRYSLTLAQNAADVADIAAYLASVTGAVPSRPDLDQYGLTGSWYEPATSGQGIEVEIFPDLASPGTGLAQVSWFTYDVAAGGADHQRWYTASGPVVSGQATAMLTIYQNPSGNFAAPPVTNAAAVGTATLAFDTCTSGQFTYAFSDGSARTGTIPLTRLTQNVTCSLTAARPVNADFALSGNWYDPATSGQGITVEVNPASGTLFFAWYTYARNAAGAGPSGLRWYTGQATLAPGARTIPVQLYETTGGVFDAPTPAGQATVPVGTGTLTFDSCTGATLAYAFTGGSSAGASGSIAMTRIGPTPKGCV